MTNSSDFQLQDFGGGYRPTATGLIFNQPFVFRMMDSRWSFIVGKEDAREVWWHSPDDDLAFVLDGSCDGPLWHDDAIPILLHALASYCLSVGATTNRNAVLSCAKAALTSFKIDS